MTDSPRHGPPFEPTPSEPAPTDPYGAYRNPYSGYSDPAYAGDSPYAPNYGVPTGPAQTEKLPPYWTQTYGSPPVEPPPEHPPQGSQTPKWLWVAAGVTIVVVIGLVAALVITNTGSDNQTVSAPTTSTQSTTTRTTPSTTQRTTPGLPFPIPSIPFPIPTAPGSTTGTTAPGETESVTYEVNGDGRALNITYVDTGSVLQTEFNVTLPWTKDVELPKPAKETASVTVVNVGSDVTCSISIAGAQVQTQSGAGLTICSPFG